MKPTPHNIKRAIFKLRRQYHNEHDQSPREINCGNCDSFAQDLLDIFPDGETMWGEDCPSRFPYEVENIDGHCFFFINDRYYDSECPDGVDSPHLLPFFIRANTGSLKGLHPPEKRLASSSVPC
jgi:hypothetical protein